MNYMNRARDFTKKNAKKLALGVIAAFVATSNVSCTSEEVAIGVGAGAIGVIIGSQIRDNYHYRDGHYYRRYDSNTRVRDRYGRICRIKNYNRRYNECMHRRHFDAEATLTEAQAVPVTANAAFAEIHGISERSASKFVSLVERARNGDQQAVADLGLQHEDIVNLMQLNMITPAGVERVATRLNADTLSVQTMLLSILVDAKAQFRSVESPLWQKCMEGGKWTTPQNMYCNSTSANGCSPDTGATMCAAM